MHLFVPEYENRRSTEVARKTCGTCPEAGPCLAFAVPLTSLRGVWGGRTSEQRRRLRRIARMAPTSPAEDLEGPTDEELAEVEAETKTVSTRGTSPTLSTYRPRPPAPSAAKTSSPNGPRSGPKPAPTRRARKSGSAGGTRPRNYGPRYVPMAISQSPLRRWR